MGLQLIRNYRADLVLDALGIQTITRDDAELDEARSTIKALENDLNIVPTEVVTPERSEVSGGAYTRTTREIVFRRTDALLVSAYTAALPPDARVSRTRISSGLTDLYIQCNGAFDLIEAKSSAGHAHVREALGQILDYAHATTAPVTTLACLFPERPASRDVELLKNYGIYCIYRTGPLLFARDAAPTERRKIWDRDGRA